MFRLLNGKQFAVLLIIFLLRFVFGLFYEFWFVDNVQIYLIGLKFFTTGVWPYFGPDIVNTGSEIPGALQGLLSGGPLFLLPIPEAPTLFLNLLSFVSLLFLAWYFFKRIGGLSFFWTALWVVTVPSALEYTTIVQNPSYVLIGAIPFFVSVFELFPFYEHKLLKQNFCFFLQGFSLLWIFQLHMSWVLLLPYIGLSFYFSARSLLNIKGVLLNLVYFMLGLLTLLPTLIPTLATYPAYSQDALSSNTHFNPSNIFCVFAIMQDFFTYPTFAFEHFLPSNGMNLEAVLPILKSFVILIPLLLFLSLLRLVQYLLILRNITLAYKDPRFLKQNSMLVFTIVVLWASFLFTEHWPNVHKYYLIMPVALWYCLQVFVAFITNKKRVTIFKFGIIASILTYCLLILVYNKDKKSLYSNRTLITSAISQKDYTNFGTRRVANIFHRNMQLNHNKHFYADTVSVFENFDSCDVVFRPQNVVNTNAYSGQFSNKCDSIQPYSQGITLPAAFWANKQSLEISAKISQNLLKELVLVVTVDSLDKNIMWQGFKVSDLIEERRTWNEMKYVIPLSNIPQSASRLPILAYFMVPKHSSSKVYIDDFCVRTF